MMECETESKYFSSDPSPPPTPPPVTSGSNPTDTCFSCKRPGHWARECPDKTPKKSPSSIPGSGPSAVDGADYPLLRCPCDRGISNVRISKTQKNPGRKFYSCPEGKRPMGCGFFKWYEEFAHLKAPMCPCGAGACILNFDSGEQRWYFSCRIKKNQGACGFKQWAESEDCQVKTKMNGNVVHEITEHESPVNSSLSSESPVIRDPEISPDFSPDVVHEITEHESPVNSSLSSESPNQGACGFKQWAESEDCQVKTKMNGNVVHEITEHESPVNSSLSSESPVIRDPMQKALRLPDLLPQSYIRCVRTKFSLEISAAGDASKDVSQQVLGVQVHGWLGRLVFPPAQCLKDPHVPSVPYPSNIESPTPVIASSNDGDAPLPNVPPLRICGENTHIRDPFISRLILKSFGQGLLDVLQSMSHSDHEAMQIVAEATFDALQRLSVDHGLFSIWVKEYICCASKLSGIEGSMRGDVSSQELIELFGNKKAQFDCVSHRHTEAVIAHKAAEGRFKALCEEASRLRELLLHIETESALCEVEASVLQTRVVEISKDKSESEMSMEAAYHEMEEALNLEHERDSVLDAAKVALESAKNQLFQQ